MTHGSFNAPFPSNIAVDVDFLHSAGYNKVCAYDLGEEIILRLRVSRALGVTDCRLVVFDEYSSRVKDKVQGEFFGIDSGRDEFLFNLSRLSGEAGLSFFHISLSTFDETYFVKKGADCYLTRDPSLDNMLQLTVSDFKYPKPRAAYGGIIYHIFVDRFMRGGDVPVSEGAVLVSGEWKNIPEYPEYPGAPLKNNTFYGGTLYGIIDKLDYLDSLGVSIIYLSPVFSSVSNHKYDTADYMTVDEMFGGDDALKLLIDKAGKKGINIILDGVFNHTGDDSIYFNKYSRFDSVGAYNSEESPYYSWYDFKSFPDKYTCWWDIPILPRINPDIPDCGEFIAGEGGVLDKYSKMGVYGFRLDVADELSDSFLAKIKNRLSQKNESLLLGEVWEDASNKVAYGVRKKYYLGGELDGVMNYPVRVGILDYLVNKGTEKLRYALCDVINNMPERIRNAQMNLLGSHDTVRALTALSGVSDEGKTNAQKREMRLSGEQYSIARARLKNAYTILATLPGIPSVFYGDEAGLQGYGDPFCRMPYPWGHEDSSILDRYRMIGKIRRENSVYREGDFELLYLTPELLIFSRSEKGYNYITFINNSSNAAVVEFDRLSLNLITGKRSKRLVLAAADSAIVKIKNNTAIELISEE